ncbi:unnamed protein product [Orchesella dallaii]|uniref:Fucosyltransferase n=1 Tax=Orchesella dallaii TaxID=48710 RepID=A0ABP1R2E9_9HEXA
MVFTNPNRSSLHRLIITCASTVFLMFLWFNSPNSSQDRRESGEHQEVGLQFSDTFSQELQAVAPLSTTTNDLLDGSSALPKKILIWNSYWKSKALWHKIFAELVNKKCPQNKCKLTINHGELNTSDAVIFHLADLSTEKYNFPESRIRNPNQIWIAMTYEPPNVLEHTGINFKRLDAVFNRTMSYRRDGDIVVRHGTFSKIQPNTILPTYTSNWINSRERISERNYAAGKQSLVAWFSSNCKSQSRREVYIKQLQKFIKVDVYGACGPYKCGVQKTMRNPYKVEEDDCYMRVSIEYKFVLAFENSLCEDYVTEKLYNHLKLNVIPVVFGASNYSIFAPPKSVIDASQYSPEELAKYLQLLDRNDTLYNEYFEWKKDYVVEAHDGVPLACDLCEQLHNPNWQKEKKVYEQFEKWITSGCRNGYGQ